MVGFPPAAPTYMEFLLLFVIAPILALALTTLPTDRGVVVPEGVGLLIVVAVLYTTPWDNHLIAYGVWDYPDWAVTRRIWHAPVEEYMFFVLQPVLTGLWLCRLDTDADRGFGLSRASRAVGVLAGLAVSGVGALLLAPESYYLGTLLVWSGPVLAVQWGFGWPVLWDLRQTWLLGVGVPTLYLAAADRLAIEWGIWTFDAAFLTGIEVFGLPVEEGLFFTVTNVFIVQGLLLLWWVTDRWPQVRARWTERTTEG